MLCNAPIITNVHVCATIKMFCIPNLTLYLFPNLNSTVLMRLSSLFGLEWTWWMWSWNWGSIVLKSTYNTFNIDKMYIMYKWIYGCRACICVFILHQLTFAIQQTITKYLTWFSKMEWIAISSSRILTEINTISALTAGFLPQIPELYVCNITSCWYFFM